MSDVNNIPENNEAPASKPAEHHAPEHIAKLAEDLNANSNASYGAFASKGAEDRTPSPVDSVITSAVLSSSLKSTRERLAIMAAGGEGGIVRYFNEWTAGEGKPLSPVAARIKRRETARSVKEVFEAAVERMMNNGDNIRTYDLTKAVDIYEVINPSGLTEIPSDCLDEDMDVKNRILGDHIATKGCASIADALRLTDSYSTLTYIIANLSRRYKAYSIDYCRNLHMNRVYVKPGAIRRIKQAMLNNGWVMQSGDCFIMFNEKAQPVAGINFDFKMASGDVGSFLDAPSYISIVGDLADLIIGLIRPELEERTMGTAKLTTIQGITGIGGLETVDDDLDEVQLANSTFYPWMNGVSLEEYFMEFLSSDANVLILYGPPGTAKSTMIRTAVKNLGLRALGTSNQQLIGNPQFLTACGSKMTGSSSNAPYDVLIAEDAEILTRSRQLGNPLMSTLLDVTSGMSAKHSFKLIITMNSENLDDVDTALLRPGRCFDIMKFGYLNEGEAANVRTSLKLPEVSIPKGKYVLAEVVNMGVTKTELVDGNAIVSPRFPLTAAHKL